MMVSFIGGGNRGTRRKPPTYGRNLTNLITYDVKIKPGLAKDSVQMDKRNEADSYIMGWWLPKTNIDIGINKVFDEMKKHYDKG